MYFSDKDMFFGTLVPVLILISLGVGIGWMAFG
jgi:uncharacterized membrane protein